MLEAGEDDLLAGLLDLAGEEDLGEDGVDLVEVEDEVELADIAKEGIEDLDEEVDGLEVGELVVVRVDADAEEQAGVSAIDDLVVPELDVRRRPLGQTACRENGDGDAPRRSWTGTSGPLELLACALHPVDEPSMTHCERDC